MLLYLQIQEFSNLTLNISKGENRMSKRQNIIAVITILIIILVMVFLKDVKVNRNSTVKDSDEASSINSDNTNSTDNEIVINGNNSDNNSSDTNTSDNNTTDKNVSDNTTSTDIPNQSDNNSKPDKPYTDINLAFTGDILLADNLYNAYLQSGVTGFISPKIADILKNADITFINEEFPFSNRGTPEAGKEYTYCVPPERAKIFNDMGVDIVSISNNHILDYGQDALVDTFSTLDEYGIDYIGAGKDLERAKKLITYKVNGKTIGFLAASRVVPNGSWYALNETSDHAARPGVFTTYDDTALCEEIRKAKEICDFVIVYAHWGIERHEVAADYQRNMAYDYINSGADLVIGSHPHVMQGVEFYNNVPIVYSMGNFLFSNYYSRTTVLTCKIKEDNTCEISFLPCGSKSYYTSETDDAGVKEFYDFLNRVSFNVTFDYEGNITHS